MLNFIPNGVSFVGIGLLVAGVMLFLLRQYRPNLARDHDIFFAAISLVSGLIFIIYGWKFDPLMQFGVTMLTASSIFFAVESIRLRGITTVQAKQGGGGEPIVDDDRPVSRVYRAELDDADDYDYDERRSRRIRGSRDDYDRRDARPSRMDAYDARPSRIDAYMDEGDYYDEPPRPRREPIGRLQPSDRDRGAETRGRSRRPARPVDERPVGRLEGDRYYEEPSTTYRDRPGPGRPPAPASDPDLDRYPARPERDRPAVDSRAPRDRGPRRARRPAVSAPPQPSRERRWDSVEDEPAAPYRRPQDVLDAAVEDDLDRRSGQTEAESLGGYQDADYVDYRPVDDEGDRPPLDL